MTYQPTALDGNPSDLPKLPGWVTSGRVETLETVAFRSGAALTVLDQLISDPRHGVPVKLLANRLALNAATATSKLEGRLARAADIRDAYHLTLPGDARAPDGDLLAFWRQPVQMRLMGRNWRAPFDGLIDPNLVAEVDNWLKAGVARARTLEPLAACVSVLRAVLEVDDRTERIVCLLSNIALARTLSWPSLLPITALFLSKAMLRDLVAEGAGGRAEGSATHSGVHRRHDQTFTGPLKISRMLSHRMI